MMSGLCTCSTQSHGSISWMLTETACSAQFAVAMIVLVTSSAIFVFWRSDLPVWSFTITWGIVVSLHSVFLARGPEHDLIDVHLVRLADGKCDRARERVG